MLMVVWYGIGTRGKKGERGEVSHENNAAAVTERMRGGGNHCEREAERESTHSRRKELLETVSCVMETGLKKES